jgi:hypothetical protein
VQADGRDDLGRGLRADSGDPFPGRTRRDWFRSHLAGGLQLTGIEVQADGTVKAHMITEPGDPMLLPATETLRLTALPSGGPVRQTVEVRRIGGAAADWSPAGHAAWLTMERAGDALVLTADPAGLVPGTYADSIRLVDDDDVTLASVVVSFYIATQGVGQIVATELPWSWGVAVRGGRILKASYGWDQLGLRPRPRVLQLWEGATHPQTLSRLAADALYAPIIDGRDGATFVLARARDSNFLYQIRANGDAGIIASHIGDEPAYGTAMLPDGSIAVAKWNGDILRVTRQGDVHAWMNVGTNIYQIASDEFGTIYAAMFSGDVLRIAPSGARRIIETGFGAGRLVAVATTPAGGLIAAERGGQGRVLHVRTDGTREMVYHRPGALFYGLAVDDGFLYALDLAQRHLLRIPLPAPPATLLVRATDQ